RDEAILRERPQRLLSLHSRPPKSCKASERRRDAGRIARYWLRELVAQRKIAERYVVDVLDARPQVLCVVAEVSHAQDEIASQLMLYLQSPFIHYRRAALILSNIRTSDKFSVEDAGIKIGRRGKCREAAVEIGRASCRERVERSVVA